MQGPGYDQESTPGLVGAGATVVVFTTGRGTTIGNAITPVIKLASNTPVFERMSNDLDLSAGGVIDGTETIDEVGQRVFERICRVASGAAGKSRRCTSTASFSSGPSRPCRCKAPARARSILFFAPLTVLNYSSTDIPRWWGASADGLLNSDRNSRRSSRCGPTG